MFQAYLVEHINVSHFRMNDFLVAVIAFEINPNICTMYTFPYKISYITSPTLRFKDKYFNETCREYE